MRGNTNGTHIFAKIAGNTGTPFTVKTGSKALSELISQ
jgi:hypothetical protein